MKNKEGVPDKDIEELIEGDTINIKEEDKHKVLNILYSTALSILNILLGDLESYSLISLPYPFLYTSDLSSPV